MKTLFILSFVIPMAIGSQLHAQSLPDYSEIKKIQLEADGYTVWAEVYTSEKEIKTDDDKLYCWVKANIVHTTQGSYDGRLLHGSYVEYYSDNQLRQKGDFKNGLRTGEWKSWHSNGMLKEKTNWKDGKRNGRFYQYNEKGEEISRGKYKEDLADGKLHFTDSSGKDSTISYKEGVLIPAKVKSPSKLKVRKVKKDIIPLEEEKKEEPENSDNEEKEKKTKKKKEEKEENPEEMKKKKKLEKEKTEKK